MPSSSPLSPPLPWLDDGPHAPPDFPPVETAWDEHTPFPGLLALGGRLDAQWLRAAYAQGIFPWFGPDDPPMWWCTHPRMVLRPDSFRLHRSLRKTLLRFRDTRDCEIRIDHNFRHVMTQCARVQRPGQAGTWIIPPIIDAYCALHAQSLAHSVETWVDGCLVGGLYCVALGRAVYGESMFAHATDASKIALAALVALCLRQAVPQIDCQQQTRHLASLGAIPIAREDFLRTARAAQAQPPLHWQFSRQDWDTLLGHT